MPTTHPVPAEWAARHYVDAAGILRKFAEGDVFTLADPSLLDTLIATRAPL